MKMFKVLKLHISKNTLNIHQEVSNLFNLGYLLKVSLIKIKNHIFK